MTSSRPYETNGYADEEELLRALDEAMATLREADIRFLVMGGIASAILGRPRWTRDVDLFVRLEDAERVLQALEQRGFETSVPQLHWLAKAGLGDVTVDVICRSTPDILLDDEMFDRALDRRFKGRLVPLVPPEDLLVMKALATTEDTPRYWHDALGIIARVDLDWDYLMRRARVYGARRVLALLLFAQSNDLVVPGPKVRALFDLVEPPVQAEEARQVVPA